MMLAQLVTNWRHSREQTTFEERDIAFCPSTEEGVPDRAPLYPLGLVTFKTNTSDPSEYDAGNCTSRVFEGRSNTVIFKSLSVFPEALSRKVAKASRSDS